MNHHRFACTCVNEDGIKCIERDASKTEARKDVCSSSSPFCVIQVDRQKQHYVVLLLYVTRRTREGERIGVRETWMNVLILFFFFFFWCTRKNRSRWAERQRRRNEEEEMMQKFIDFSMLFHFYVRTTKRKTRSRDGISIGFGKNSVGHYSV